MKKVFMALIPIIFIILAIFVCLSIYTNDDLAYALLDDGTYEVVGMGNCTESNVKIPTTYRGKAVTSISMYAFIEANIVSIEIPECITNISWGAFWDCTNLINIIVNKNNNVYKSINGDIYTKDGKTLVQYAIGKTNKSFVIPDTVTNIGGYAFCNCGNITSITIPNSVTNIGDYAFYNCNSITDIMVPDNVANIGTGAFYSCANLQYNKYDNSQYIGNDINPYLVLVKAADKSIATVTIHHNTKFIHSYAFANCSNLENLTIPDKVTSIGSGAFQSCKSITSITISEGAGIPNLHPLKNNGVF